VIDHRAKQEERGSAAHPDRPEAALARLRALDPAWIRPRGADAAAREAAFAGLAAILAERIDGPAASPAPSAVGSAQPIE